MASFQTGTFGGAMREDRNTVPLLVPLEPRVRVFAKDPVRVALRVIHLNGLSWVLLVRLMRLKPVLLTVPLLLK